MRIKPDISIHLAVIFVGGHPEGCPYTTVVTRRDVLLRVRVLADIDNFSWILQNVWIGE
jgi:hypothetical protein